MYSQEDLAAVKRETNIYEHIIFLTETNKFMVMIPKATYRPSFDTLSEAIEVRDRMLKSPHFPKVRYEPHKEYATYVDLNLEARNYEAS